MAINNQDGATTRSDNRRMTGNVNIYICSEAFDKDLNVCRSSNGVKFRLNDTKTSGILSTNVDDLLLENTDNNERETKVMTGEKNKDDLKNFNKGNRFNTDKNKKMSKREGKVKVQKEKKKLKGSEKSKTNNTWFSYFWRRNDSDEKEVTKNGDENLCTCKKKLNTNSQKIRKDDRKKRKKDGEKSIPSTKTHKIKNNSKNKRKTHKDSKSKTPEKLSNKKQNDNFREIPKSSSLSERQKDVSKTNEPEKYSSTNKKTDKILVNNSSANEESYDSKKSNSKMKSSTHKVKFKNKTNRQRDTIKTQKSKIESKKTKEENSFLSKFLNLFKSKAEVPKRKTKNTCHPSCNELKKTAKTSSSVQRRNKTKRKRYKSELAGKVKQSKLTEQDFSTSNKSHIQVNENDRKNKKIGVYLTNDLSDIEGATNNYKKENHYLNEKYEIEKNIKTNKLRNIQDSKEIIKKNIKQTNIEENSTKTNQINTNDENSLQLCFSCLFPSSDCLCRKNFPNNRCDCKKIVTFGGNDINKSTNDKRPHISEVQPYQKTRNFSKVVDDIQGKIDESTNTKYTQNPKHTCTCKECCSQNDLTDEKLRAKCYCKNLPCRCCVNERPRYIPKR